MRYTFGNCELDTERHELRRAGQAVGIRPKVLQVLAYLIEHRDRAISKQELFERCWTGRVVGDDALNSVIRDARRAVGDSGDKQGLIRTLHGHGYHFVASVDETGADLVAPQESIAPLSDREHKQVSILCCSIVNADALATDAGAERLDGLTRRFFATVRSTLERYEGTIIEQATDGFTAVFGAPRAQEDHARRAAVAALELQRLADATLTLKTGLHTGSVLAGSLGEDQLYSAVGSAIRHAHSIHEHAEGLILASRTFYELVETELGVTILETDANDPLYRIERVTEPRAGVPHRGPRRQAQFVARQAEMTIIGQRRDLAVNGEGQAVCISGEPGIGKSRVLEELRAELSTQQNLYLQANCLAYRSSTPYFPLVQIVRRLLDIDRFDTQTGLAEALDRKLSDANIEDSSARDALMHFLDAADAFELEAESIPASSRDQLFDIATRLLLHASRRRPVVVAIEDLHWQDATSEQWLSSFIHRMTGARILLLLTYRPGYQATWLPSSAVTQLALPRLNDTDSAELVDSLQLDIPASTELRQQIVNHAQGIPFFLEELAFNLADRGELTGYDVPKTVQAVLAARIDQLDASDKTVLQTAAVIGMPVPRDVLEAVTALDEQTLDGCTDRLQTAELLFEADTDGGRALRFKHALTQDVAYQSLLGSARRECHRVIAACYEEQFPERAETQPELVAHHYGEAGLAERALDYWYRAGVRAAQRSANPEAVVHFEQALKASEALPESRELGERQLDIFLRMGPPLMSSKAFTSPDVEQAYLKGKTLCETLDDRDSLFTVLWGLWLHKSHRGEIEQARALSAKILELARTLDDPEKTMQAHHTGWTNEIWHGDLNACQEHAMEGNRLYDPVKHKRHKYLYGGHDPGVCARGTAGIAAWFLGYPDQALELVESGAALAIELDHPFSQVITHHDFMEIAMLMRNPDMCQEYAERAIERCEQIHVPNYLAVGHVFAGWAKFRAAGDTAGITQMRQGLEDFKSLGAVRNLAPYLLLLADVLTTAEGCAEGLDVIDEAESLIAHTGEIRWQPEVIRLRGEMLLLASSDNAPQADALFGDALELAGEHACKSFELRAALSLSRLLHSQGDAGDARNTLQPVYDWFTEGFETGDLRQARALLDSIS